MFWTNFPPPLFDFLILRTISSGGDELLTLNFMRKIRLARAAGVLTLLLLLAAGSAARSAEETTALRYIRIDLLDGRTLKDVVVKSYDPGSGKLLVTANGRAQLIPLRLLPPPFAARLKTAAPEGGSTTAVVAPPLPIPRSDAPPPQIAPEIAPSAPGSVDPYSPAEIEK